MTIRAVIFDIYGTLLEVGTPPPDADTRWQRLFRDLLHLEPRFTRLGFSVATGKVLAERHQAARAHGIVWPEVQWPTVASEVVPELAQLPPPDQEEFLFLLIQTGHTTRVTAEAVATLRWLKERRCPLGIASNAQAYTRRELREALAAAGLGIEAFDPALCFWSFEHGFSKPDPHVFRILASRLEARGIAPAQTLMIGDRLDTDIDPALAHGWRVWHLRNEPADTAGGNWTQLRDWLDRAVSPPSS